eukprot:CFRG8490T1
MSFMATDVKYTNVSKHQVKRHQSPSRLDNSQSTGTSFSPFPSDSMCNLLGIASFPFYDTLSFDSLCGIEDDGSGLDNNLITNGRFSSVPDDNTVAFEQARANANLNTYTSQNANNFDLVPDYPNHPSLKVVRSWPANFQPHPDYESLNSDIQPMNQFQIQQQHPKKYQQIYSQRQLDSDSKSLPQTNSLPIMHAQTHSQLPIRSLPSIQTSGHIQPHPQSNLSNQQLKRTPSHPLSQAHVPHKHSPLQTQLYAQIYTHSHPQALNQSYSVCQDYTLPSTAPIMVNSDTTSWPHIPEPSQTKIVNENAMDLDHDDDIVQSVQNQPTHHIPILPLPAVETRIQTHTPQPITQSQPHSQLQPHPQEQSLSNHQQQQKPKEHTLVSPQTHHNSTVSRVLSRSRLSPLRNTFETSVLPLPSLCSSPLDSSSMQSPINKTIDGYSSVKVGNGQTCSQWLTPREIMLQELQSSKSVSAIDTTPTSSYTPLEKDTLSQNSKASLEDLKQVLKSISGIQSNSAEWEKKFEANQVKIREAYEMADDITDKEMRRKHIHRYSEMSRRERLKQAFRDLQQAIPNCLPKGKRNSNRGVILQDAIDYIDEMNETRNQLLKKRAIALEKNNKLYERVLLMRDAVLEQIELSPEIGPITTTTSAPASRTLSSALTMSSKTQDVLGKDSNN